MKYRKKNWKEIGVEPRHPFWYQIFFFLVRQEHLLPTPPYMCVAYQGGEASLRSPEGKIWPDDFWKNSSLQGRTKFQSTPVYSQRFYLENRAGGKVRIFGFYTKNKKKRGRQLLVRHGAGLGTCDYPCILGRVLNSAFMQAKVRLTCCNSLIYTGRHTFQRHASRATAYRVD